MAKIVKPEERRIQVNVRLPKWLVDKVDSLGKRTEIIERAVMRQIGVKNDNSQQ